MTYQHEAWENDQKRTKIEQLDFWRENSNIVTMKIKVDRFARIFVKWDILGDFQTLWKYFSVVKTELLNSQQKEFHYAVKIKYFLLEMYKCEKEDFQFHSLPSEII